MADATLPEESVFNKQLFVENSEPITDEHFAMCRCAVDDVSAYKQVHSSKYSQIFKDKEKGDLRMYKVHETVINADVVPAFDLKDDLEFLVNCDSSIRDAAVKAPKDEVTACDILYYAYKTPPGIKNRDFLLRRAERRDEANGVYEYIQRSTLWDGCGPRDKHVRAFLFLYARFEDVPGDTKRHRAKKWLCSDPRGKIPNGLIQRALVKGMDKSVKDAIKLHATPAAVAIG